jgi:hypothetical protein
VACHPRSGVLGANLLSAHLLSADLLGVMS